MYFKLTSVPFRRVSDENTNKKKKNVRPLEKEGAPVLSREYTRDRGVYKKKRHLAKTLAVMREGQLFDCKQDELNEEIRYIKKKTMLRT